MDFALFEKSYRSLNPQQKQAVDTTEGPVMVVAGAGTGKTQTIALRIANILKNTQTPPGAILCLTFTDNAATNMRQRLLSLIGPTAYKVGIYTFHSFCNEVITSHPQYFLFAQDLRPLDDLEKIEIIKEQIESLPLGADLKPWGDHFYYQREIMSRISDLKRENITPPTLLSLVQSQLEFSRKAGPYYESLKTLRASKELDGRLREVTKNLLNTPNIPESIFNALNYYYQLYLEDKFALGTAKTPSVNFKNFLANFLQKLSKNAPKQVELHQIYQQYQDSLRKKGLYDYDDMILFVLNAFKENPDLLSEYQERYQYVLVDEYQDTNSSQNEIIDLIASFFQQPNLFVVGDDDQSIFRFQGAAIENIYHFYLKYLKPNHLDPIVLSNNYRSHQLILDTSTALISQNKYRIANLIDNVDKSLKANADYDPTPIQLLAAPNPATENYYVGKTIKKLLLSGVTPSEVAVLCRTNADVTDLVETLTLWDIPCKLETGQDILSLPHISQLITFMEFLVDPTADHLLYKVLNFPFLKINFVDLFVINQYCYRHRLDLSSIIMGKSWPPELKQQLKPATMRRLNNLRKQIALAQKWLNIYSPQRYFNRVIRKFGYLASVTSQNNIDLINTLNCFYQELKKQTQERELSIPQFLNRLQLMKENHLTLSPPPLDYDYTDCVRLMTVHKAKGLEFEHVFIIKFLDKKWGNNRSYDSLVLPLGLIKTELALSQVDEDFEDERRLFYVALTRAKKQIYITYPTRSQSNRELLPSVFISEIDPALIESVSLPPGFLKDSLTHQYTSPLPKSHQAINTQKYLKQYLSSNYCFNVTHLNSYLKCPLCFYYQTILRIPSPKDKHSSLGTAIHRTLSHLYQHLKSKGKLMSSKDLLACFQKYLSQEGLTPLDYEESLLRGQENLTNYYQNYVHEFNPNVIMDYDFRSQNVRLDSVPITGKIDKIEILNDSAKPQVNLVDYKTGNPDSKSAELRPGGDYFRQLVFYLILARNAPDFNYEVQQGTIDFIFKSQSQDKFVRKYFTFTETDVSFVESQISEVYQKILNLQFPVSAECKNRLGFHELLK